MDNILEQKHNELLIMMEKVHAILEENNIHYLLIFGSALGAVRHNDIIPWDDDIDIGIMREELDKAEELLSSELDYLYESAEHHLEPSAPIGHIRYVNKNNAEELHDLKRFSTIDVWPIDKIPTSKKGMSSARRNALLHDFSVYRKPPVHRGNAIRLICSALLAITPSKVIDRIQSKTLSKITGYKDEDYYLTHNLFFAKYKYFDKEIFTERVYMDFANMKLPIPREYDKYLTIMYGDYMTPPAPDKRITTHSS